MDMELSGQLPSCVLHFSLHEAVLQMEWLCIHDGYCFVAVVLP